MIIARKILRNLMKEKASAIKIQRKFRKFRKMLNLRKIQQLNQKKIEISTKKPSPIKEVQNNPILQNPYEILNQIKPPAKDPKEKEKSIQKQKESIRHLYEPALKKMNTAKIRLQKIQSNKDLEENHTKFEKKLSKKSSNPIMIKDNSIENGNSNSNNDSFSNKMNNTKKINNLIATSNNVINNLTRIYGGGEKKKQENKRMKTLEDQNINDLFTFFHKKLNK